MAKILIVEDDPLIARMYEKALSFEGYEVEVATDGAEGLKKIQEWQPRLVLLDIMMPTMNGLEVLENLKADPATKEIPVVVLTNLTEPADAQAALEKGAVKYIVKSAHVPKEIVIMVKEILTSYTRHDVPRPTN